MKNSIKYFFRKIENFFLWSSGADLNVLQQVPMEKNKFLGIGGTIIFTALMASFAGGYAFFTAFKSTYLSVPFGLFWGALIFNLDRYIVTSFGVGDGKKTISKQEWIEAAPRLAMAIILGFVISTPLELKLFEKEITVEVKNIINEERIKLGENETPIYKLISEKRNEINGLKAEQLKAENKAEELPSKATIEDGQIKLLQEEIGRVDGMISQNNSSWAKFNKIWEETESESEKAEIKKKRDQFGNSDLNKRRSSLLNQINTLNGEKFERGKNYFKKADELNKINQPKIDALEKEIKVLEAKVNSIGMENEDIASQYSGLMAKLEALSRLTDKYAILFFVKWMITILFVFIEIAPILFKMMTERGPYDDIMDRMKHEHKVRQLEIQSNTNQEINTAVRLHTDKFEQKLNAELQANKEILEAISKAQQEIALVAIETWKEEQKKNMKENGSSIIKSING